MASDRKITSTEQIAHSISDRYQLPNLPSTDELADALSRLPFTPLELEQLRRCAEMKRWAMKAAMAILVAAGKETLQLFIVLLVAAEVVIVLSAIMAGCQ